MQDHDREGPGAPDQVSQFAEMWAKSELPGMTPQVGKPGIPLFAEGCPKCYPTGSGPRRPRNSRSLTLWDNGWHLFCTIKWMNCSRPHPGIADPLHLAMSVNSLRVFDWYTLNLKLAKDWMQLFVMNPSRFLKYTYHRSIWTTGFKTGWMDFNKPTNLS